MGILIKERGEEQHKTSKKGGGGLKNISFKSTSPFFSELAVLFFKTDNSIIRIKPFDVL